jgi:hypothetical protein
MFLSICMAKLLHIILELRHDTISQIAARKLSRSHQLRTQAPALLLITEARRIIRREQHAAITSLGGTGALSLHTQYDVYLAAPDHLLSVRRSPPETASRYLHVACMQSLHFISSQFSSKVPVEWWGENERTTVCSEHEACQQNGEENQRQPLGVHLPSVWEAICQWI